jgi:hypothetical protein
MPRAYTIATVALTLGTSAKWLDNILSHHPVTGVQQQRQGVSRRLAFDAILVLAIILLLIQDVGLATPHAVDLAEALVAGGGQYTTPRGFSIALELNALRERVFERLENAVEVAPVPRRGRPPASKTGRLD